MNGKSTDKNQKSFPNELQILWLILDKEFNHLLHVENRANIILGAISFITVGVVMVYTEFRLKINFGLFIISSLLFIGVLILFERALSSSFGIMLPEQGIISHRALRSRENICQYLARFNSFIENPAKLKKDLATFVKGVALMAAIKKSLISIATHLFIIDIIIGVPLLSRYIVVIKRIYFT